MDFEEYQRAALKYNTFNKEIDFNDPDFVEKALGLVGEAGEAADKIKKVIRDKEGRPTDMDVIEISKELGDVLWYVSSLSSALGMNLKDVAEGNLDKLESRWQRDLLHGSGDNR